MHYKALKRITPLLKTRIRQRAVHPNATQFTLQQGEKMFGFGDKA